jgi:hypothetical protein
MTGWSILRLHVLKAAVRKITVLWDVELCSLIDIERRFKRDYCLNNQGDRLEIWFGDK